uniref:VWFA domain-containing protein n=2 Tax=Cavia porcellus TaxID=10141 RepID=A0A286XUR8_CAVPO
MRKHRHLPLVATFCLFLSGFSTTYAQTAQDSADLIFLIDGSNYTGSSHFAVILDFLVNLLERLSVGLQQIRV